jgi:hypothetical protein
MFAPSLGVHGAAETASWVDASAEVAQPPLAGGSGARVTQWIARRAPATRDTLLLGCVATPIPGWVEDLRPSVEQRTLGLMTASAERAVGSPVEARTAEVRGVKHFLLRAAGHPETAPPLGIGRTFLGWDARSVVTCLAVCATPGARGEPSLRAPTRPCDATVLDAELEGSAAAPPAGLALTSVTWAVHHPATSVTWGACGAAALGALAVAFRRRPRSRI